MNLAGTRKPQHGSRCFRAIGRPPLAPFLMTHLHAHQNARQDCRQCYRASFQDRRRAMCALSLTRALAS